MTSPSPLQWGALLYGGVTPPAGFVEFRFLKGGARAWMPWPAFEGHPEEFKLSDAPRGKNVYFGVALRTPDAPEAEKGDKAHCHPTHLVWTEIDLKDHPELTGGQTAESLRDCPAEELAGYKQELLRLTLAEAGRRGLPPRAIVDSGHGLHVYWARRARSTSDDTEAFNRALSGAFGGGTESTDVSRILRLPGTLNLKNPARPLAVEIVWQDPDAWVEETALAALPAPQKAQPEPSRISPPTSPAQPLTGTAQERYAQAALQREVEALRATGEGGRNDQLNRSAFNVGTLIGAGVLDEVEAERQLREAAESVGLDAGEIRDTLRSGLEGGKQKPRDLSTVGQRKPPTTGRGTIGKNAEGQAPRSSAAIAEGLPDKPTLAQFRDLVLASFMERGLLYRYHQIWRTWWRYEGGVYEEVPDEVMAQVVDLTLQDYGHTLKNAQVSEVMTKIARDPGVGSREVDQGSWHLNTRNGVLDLETGELYEHTPEYFSIIQSAAAYRPETVAHEWLSFLRRAVPSEGDRTLLQQFAGLCLTGDTSPQKALLLIGEGGTGKGTFTRVLSAVLGSLATSSALENIRDGSFLVGTLVGKRMCTVSELQRNVDWLPFKRITGEDAISVDVKNKTPYTTKLDMKLVILSNVFPHLGEDTANTSLMRRFLPIEFNVKPETPDPHLEGRLTHPDELPGVLNWMLEGLATLRANGMRFPSSDAAALAREIVEESNRVISFVRDECLYVPEAQTGSTELYTAYRKWCGETGHKPLSSISFGKQLIAAGKHFGKPIDRFKDRVGRGYVNITVSTSPGGWEES